MSMVQCELEPQHFVNKRKSFFCQTADDVMKFLESTVQWGQYGLKVYIQWLSIVLIHYVTPCVLLLISCSIIKAATDDVI